MKFLNLDGSAPQPLGSVLRWALVDRLSGARKPDTRPFSMPRVENDGKAIRENTGEPWVTWVGHATFLVQLAGKNVLLDPIWAKAIGGVVKRLSEPGLRIEDLPRIDAVLVSHNHRDHMDAPTLKHFCAAQAIVPTGLAPAMRKLGYSNVVELWGTYQLTDEWLGEPPQKLRALLAGADDAERVHLAAIGETIRLER